MLSCRPILRLVCLVICCLFWIARPDKALSQQAAPTPAEDQRPVYLFSYFIHDGEEGLHLAYRHDGLVFEKLERLAEE